ncbi:MAG: hypothetical protein HPAVJP_2060 [Candidatus Hepatoplasma vulgare]|nr:MAG: hypothetical protein HPAVJP_2060 [Candidatus Hepatoplasma sp.]
MIVFSPIQKQQYKSRNLLLELLSTIISSYEAIDTAIRSKNPEKYLIKVFSNEKKYEESFPPIKDYILKGFLQAPLGKDLRRNIAYFQILNSYKTINKFTVQISRYILETKNEKLSFDWIKNFLTVIINKLKKILIILEKEDVDLIKEIIQNDSDVNILFEDAISNIIHTKTLNPKKTQDIREKEINILLITKNLERTGDKIREIANQIYFIATGEEYFV